MTKSINIVVQQNIVSISKSGREKKKYRRNQVCKKSAWAHNISNNNSNNKNSKRIVNEMWKKRENMWKKRREG